MRKKLMVVGVATLLAGMVAFALFNYLSTIETQIRGDVELVQVYRAAGDIAEGTAGEDAISSGLIAVSSEEAQFVPAAAVTDEQAVRDLLVGAVAAGPIAQGQVITSAQWVPAEDVQRTLSEIIPPGHQAMTVEVDRVHGVAGMVNPGDHVNLLVTIDVPDPATTSPLYQPSGSDTTTQEQPTITVSHFVLQNIPVLAIEQNLSVDKGAAGSVEAPSATDEAQAPTKIPVSTLVTLDVTGDQAEQIAFSFEQGSVWMTLVPDGFVPETTDGVIAETLFDNLDNLGALQAR